MTAEKSTNHRTGKPSHHYLPVVHGTKQGIILNARGVHTNSDGTGGTGDTLAKAIFTALKNHVGFRDELLQVQGRVMDGGYLNDAIWWPVQWDPVHLLDKVY